MPIGHPDLSNVVNNVTTATSNSLISETAASGPSVNGNNYAGTVKWNFDITGYGYGLTYWMVYDVRVWNNTTSAWDFLTAGTIHISDTAGTAGAHTVDLFVNSSLAAHGDYGITSYLVKENNLVAFTTPYKFYYSTTHSPSFSAVSYGYNIAMNDLGDDPPITQPELPPTGPVGPGSSS